MIDKDDIKELVGENLIGTVLGDVKVGSNRDAVTPDLIMELAADMARAIDLTIELSRSEMMLTRHDLIEGFRQRMSAAGYDEFAEWATDANVAVVVDSSKDDKVVYACLILGSSMGPAPWKNSENQEELDRLAFESLVETAKEKDLDLAELIGQDVLDSKLNERFQATIERTSDLTEAEVADFRDEIDRLFPTKGGDST